MYRMLSLPVLTHGQANGRISDAELARFESVLDSADHAVDACMRGRTKLRVPSTESSTTDMLLALVKTVGATTGAREPDALTSQRELVTWVHAAITEKSARDVHPSHELTLRREGVTWVHAAITEKSARDVRVATKHSLVEPMDTAILAQCLELISKLTALSSSRRATAPRYEACA